MIRFLLRRAVFFVATFFVVMVAAFTLMHSSTAGNPFSEEKELSPEATAALMKKYHLDLPVLINTEVPFASALTQTQLGYYLADLMRGDLGPTYRYEDTRVNDVLGPAIPVSMLLGVIGLCFAIGIGLPAGIIAAVKQNSWADRAAITVAMGGVILPNFILGPLLVILFAFVFKLLPPAGWGRPIDVILPGFLTGLPAAAMIARLTRSGMIEELRSEYVRAARARGVHEFRVVMKHALKNAIMPVVSYLGPAAAGILTGTVVIETLFAIPGMGSYFVHGALQRDYKLVMGAVLLYCAVLMTFNFLVDIAYRFLDPRVAVR